MDITRTPSSPSTPLESKYANVDLQAYEDSPQLPVLRLLLVSNFPSSLEEGHGQANRAIICLICAGR